MEVTREMLEATLETLRGQISDRLAGIHGPGSLAWEHGREVANFLGSGRAVLLQLAHAPVAAAIAEHSKTFVDLRGRFERTFKIVFAMTFGDLDDALSSARRLHRIHQRVTGTLTDGTAYAANSKPSLRWVYATLVDSVFAVRKLVAEPLTPGASERYYRETKRFALLFGLDPDDLPQSYCDFQEYMRDSIADPAMISVSAETKAMADALFTAPHRSMRGLASRFSGITSALLPELLARDFAIDLSRREHARASRDARRLFRALQQSPSQMRFFPHYLDAMARVGEREGLGRRVDRALSWLLRMNPIVRSLSHRA